jgi:glycosyltransferase involved in cell wall biosynthesis
VKTISIVSPCYNEEENVTEVVRRVREVMAGLPEYRYEHLFIDNRSEDGTLAVLRRLAAEDRRVKVIVNARNFGHIRSPYYGLLQARGDAVISLASDLQDPPELIREFILKWAAGARVVVGVKTSSQESGLVYWLRGLYYRGLRRVATVELLEHFTGFGLYDRAVMDVLRGLREPYPYFRGLISDLGFDIARVEFTQPRREHGVTKNNFTTLLDMALLGVTNHTKIPLRIATTLGFVAAGVSFLVGLGYLVAKLVFWDTFNAGIAPLVLGMFFFGSIQLLFLGLIGEYVGAIFTYVQGRPLVIEKERINFEDDDGSKGPGGRPSGSW